MDAREDGELDRPAIGWRRWTILALVLALAVALVLAADASGMLARDCGREPTATKEPPDARVRDCLLTAYARGSRARGTVVGWSDEGGAVHFENTSSAWATCA